MPPPGVSDETCQGCVPLAFRICDRASSFEDAIRSAVAYGGDSDTLAAIVGSLVEARWEITEDIRNTALRMLPKSMVDVIIEFENIFKNE